MSSPPTMSALPLPSSVCQNYANECEDAVNMLIKLELYTSNMYKSISDDFNKEEVDLKPFSHYFLMLLHRAQDQAEKLTQLQSLRGSQLRSHKIQAPNNDHWESGLKAMEFALMMENTSKDLLDLHQLATNLHDGHLHGFLKKQFLLQQVQSIKKLEGHVYKLRKVRVPEAVFAEYLFNNMTMLHGDNKD